MGKIKKVNNFHVVTIILIFTVIMFMVFSSDNPMVILSTYILTLGITIFTKSYRKLFNGLFYFAPFAVLIIIANLIFVTQGSTTLFYIGSKKLTLESLIYAIVLCFKFLAVIYLFMSFQLMIDSDKAVSYFSSKMPKSTLTLMLIFKLIPGLKNKFYSLKEIYTVRGVDFKVGDNKSKVKSYSEVMTVLLESSLESSFDIGEAAFVRGFLSNKRSVYERESLGKKDILLIISSLLLIIIYILSKIMGFVTFEIYEGVNISNIFNAATILILSMICYITFLICIFSKEVYFGLHRD
ncbi:energy-coupling factor transport system permease protein [Clostridium amylolyticum]|uniref:Energy-coupling factor transport system permease protein n=1 Tax=Clostridium amylolyticum TaxID=1121298 RepID=A0A1M6NQV8_9CLOT|nr:energy-coupling factor transporter transmembrane component T [Clostridium amylolyticum]SHJ98030.1 energy-coupling factor transport system permease protein [Clostridium amylolyticum]